MSDVIGTAKIVAEVDSSGVEVGVAKVKRSLKDIGTTAKTAGKEASESIGSIGDGGKTSAAKVDAATKNMIGSIQRTIAAMEAGSKSGSEYYRVLAGQRGVDTNLLKPYLEQLDAASSKQVKTGISAGQMSFALRGVPAQFTDIATSLASGQRPLQVFLQQGGQLKDMFGGIAPAAKALGGYLVGLINPFTIAAAAVAATAYAYSEGSKESDAYAKSLILSGNAIGETVGGLGEMAKRIDAVTGTQSAAAAALAQFAAGTDISSKNLERFSTIAVQMEERAGQAVSETVKQFSELGKSPVEASEKLNEKTHFLTISIYEQIKALSEQGKTADAAALAQSAYADALDTRLGQLTGRLGAVESAWKFLSGTAKEAWDSMLDVGRTDTNQEKLSSIANQIKQAQAELKRTNESGGGLLDQFLGDNIKGRIASLIQEQSVLQGKVKLENDSAKAQKTAADQVKARVEFDKEGNKFLSESAKLEREIAEARNKGVAAGASQAEIEKRIADIRASHKSIASTALGIDKSQLGIDIDAIKSANDHLVSSYVNAEKNIEALHSAHLISESQYYSAKSGFINAEAQANEDALKKEIERYQQEKLAGKDKLDNDKKIAKAESDLALLRANTSAKLAINSIQEVAANTKIEQSYEDARQAAKAYLDTVSRQNAADINGIGKGNEFRTNQAGRNQIENKFTGQRQGLERDKRNGLIDQEQFNTYLSIAEDTYQKELKAYEDRTAGIKDAQSSWTTGAEEAFANYQSNAENVAAQSAAAFSDAFNGITDGISSSIAQAIVEGKNLEDSLKAVAINVAEAFIESFIKVQIAKLFVDKTAATGYAATVAAQSQAMVAMAGLSAFASTAAIPIVGPAAAPAAAAAAIAIAEGFATAATTAAITSIASARGGYDIPAGVNPMTQLHEQEMVLPKEQANVIRDLARGSNTGSGAVTIINQTSAKIGKVTERRAGNGERALILEEAVEAVAAQMADPNSKTSRAMSRNFSLQRSR